MAIRHILFFCIGSGLWGASATAWAADDVEKKCDDSQSTFHYRLGQGVRLETCDRKFAFHTWIRSQIRYDAVVPHDSAEAGVVNYNGDPTQTLKFHRAALFFAGNAFGVHNKYFFQLAFSPADMGLKDGKITQSPLFDWFFTFDYLRDFSVRLGVYKPFFGRQFIGAWGDLQLVDRSTVQGEFLLDRDVGVDLYSDDIAGLNKFRYHVGLFMNQGRNNIDARNFHVMPVVRLEYLPFGAFDDYRESDLERHGTPKLALAAAYAYSDHASKVQGVRGDAPADGGTTNFHTAVADMMFKYRGASMNAEMYWRDGSRNGDGKNVDATTHLPITATLARNGWGYFVQAGWLLPKLPFEIAARGGQLFKTGNSSIDTLGELGAGLNYYFAGHGCKVQLDYFRNWKNQSMADGADIVRLAFQLQV